MTALDINNHTDYDTLHPSRNRHPAVAGQFYSGDAHTLKKELETLFNTATSKQLTDIRALIVPHAGYVFSGKTAAKAFKQIDTNKKYHNIFILTSSHTSRFSGASIYHEGHYEMPMGKVKVNRQLAKNLIDKHSCFDFLPDVHTHEHSLEVQLPFLQFIMNDYFQIVPVVIGSNSVSTIEDIALALAPFFNDDNLFIVSTDFSHYPSYENAQKVDKKTINAICSNSSETLLKVLDENKKMDIPELSTSLCGWSAVLTLLKITEKYHPLKTLLLDYCNSGDALYGDKIRVVGYAAIAFFGQEINSKKDEENDDQELLDNEEKKTLLQIARKTLEESILSKRQYRLKNTTLNDKLHKPLGAFVSLYINDKLRGCVGRFQTSVPLYQTIQDMVISAATKDTRFDPVRKSELKKITIEISVLSELKRIQSPDELIVGKHGIFVKKGKQSGTYLPQVVISENMTATDFIEHCAQYKAGLNPGEWHHAELYTYTACVFSENMLSQ